MDFPSDSRSEDNSPSELSTEDSSQCTEGSAQDQNIRPDVERETNSPARSSVKGKTGPVVTSPSASRASGRDVLCVIGGFCDVDTVETLDPAVGSWVSYTIQDAPRGWTWIGSVGHKVLVLEMDNIRFRSFDVLAREWTQLQYLPQHRWFYAMAASGDQVYVLGGEEPHGTRCDRYDAQNDRWAMAAPMLEGKIFAATVCHAGKLYCSGGRSVPGDRLLSSLEVLEPRGNGKWASLPPMGVGRSTHCLASCGRFLWAIGGWDGKTVHSDVEKYDVEGRQWSFVQPLGTSRCSLSSSVVGGRVHVIGGLTTGWTRVRTVEVYDEEEDQWAPAAPLHGERSGHGSCLVLSLPDVDQLAVPIE